jgi:hypothetical protein
MVEMDGVWEHVQNGRVENVERSLGDNSNRKKVGYIVLLFIFSSLFHNQADHMLIWLLFT